MGPVVDAGVGKPVIEIEAALKRQEAFRSLLAFSGLREQLRNPQSQSDQDLDLFETERFILDEVLQLICDRAEAITSTDGILVALTEGPDLVCRAASGTTRQLLSGCAGRVLCWR